MTGGVSTLANRIVGELHEVQRVTLNVQKDWQNFLRTADDGYLKATAFDLHSFYTGLERVFRLIAEILEQPPPQWRSVA